MIKFIKNLFNSKENTYISQTKSGRHITTPAEKMSEWLSHPNEYGVRPDVVEVIESGSYNYITCDMEVKYSLVKYRIPNNEKIEIGIVGEYFTWSFLDVIDYENTPIEKIRKAYIGKHIELMNTLYYQQNGFESKYSKLEQIKRAQAYLNSIGNSIELFDVYEYERARLVFFVGKITENGGAFMNFTGYIDLEKNDYVMDNIIRPRDPFLDIAIYEEIGNTLSK